MAKKDATTKLLTKDNDVFAELFNSFVFGKSVVDPKKLQEKDTSAIAMVFSKIAVREKFRDVLKHAELKTDDRFSYFLLGLENQSDIHYAMPVRTMLYDAISYSQQIADTSRHMRKDNERKYSDQEWLSGFPKDGIIKPVITLVLCWSPEKWDGPRSLYEMMDRNVIESYGSLIEDYRLHLASVSEIEDEQLQSFKTDIGLALEFSKYSNENKKLEEFSKDDRFRNRSNEFVATINEMTKTQFSLNMKGGTVDMCEGLVKLCDEYFEKGESKGRIEGISETIQKVEKVLRSEGNSEEYIQSICSKIESLK